MLIAVYTYIYPSSRKTPGRQHGYDIRRGGGGLWWRSWYHFTAETSYGRHFVHNIPVVNPVIPVSRIDNRRVDITFPCQHQFTAFKVNTVLRDETVDTGRGIGKGLRAFKKGQSGEDIEEEAVESPQLKKTTQKKAVEI